MATKVAISIRENAVLFNDDRMMAHLAGTDMISREVTYYHSCRKEYLNRVHAASTIMKLRDIIILI